VDVVPFEPSHAAEWDRLVAATPGALVGHDRRWPALFAAAFGHRPLSLVALDGERARGVLPLVEIRNWIVGRLIVSLPWLDAAGVCAPDDEARAALLDAAEALARSRGARSLEVRSLAPAPGLDPSSHAKAVLLLPLPESEGAAWDRFDAKLRNQIRKAERSGLTVEVGGRELLPAFYDPFSRNMRELGVPVWGLDFYEKILSTFRDEADVLIVRDAGEAIGGAILLRWKDAALVPCASSLRARFEKCPNHALYWAAIRRAIERGARVFDFGRSTVDSGTYRFKKTWGSEPVLCRWDRPLEREGAGVSWTTANPKLRLFVAAWRRLPLSFTRAVGPRIVRNLP